MDATQVSVDAQGRVTIPPALMSRAGLGKDATLHGVGDHIEIWNPERLKVVIEEAQANFEANAEEVLGEPGA
jgi:MraZ protein